MIPTLQPKADKKDSSDTNLDDWLSQFSEF